MCWVTLATRISWENTRADSVGCDLVPCRLATLGISVGIGCTEDLEPHREAAGVFDGVPLLARNPPVPGILCVRASSLGLSS
jgi:hypothetical protein